MTSKSKIALIGLSGESVFMKVDHFHTTGETIKAKEIHIEPGGKGYNQAVAIAKLGGEPYLLSMVGDDYYGKICEDYLIDHGVKSYLHKHTHLKTAFASILTDQLGENQVTVFPGAANELSAQTVEGFEETIKKCAALLVTFEVPLPALYKAIELAKKHHVLVILNPAPAIIDDIIKQCDIITPNEVEARTIFGLAHHLPIDEIIPLVLESDFKRVVITLGKNGCLLFDNQAVKKIPSVKVKAIDTTGAGDIFNAALTVGITKGWNFETAVKFANQIAAFSVTKKYVMKAIESFNEIDFQNFLK